MHLKLWDPTVCEDSNNFMGDNVSKLQIAVHTYTMQPRRKTPSYRAHFKRNVKIMFWVVMKRVNSEYSRCHSLENKWDTLLNILRIRLYVLLWWKLFSGCVLLNPVLNVFVSLSLSHQAEPEGFSHFHLYVCAAFLVRWRKEILEERDFQVIRTQDTGGAIKPFSF